MLDLSALLFLLYSVFGRVLTPGSVLKDYYMVTKSWEERETHSWLAWKKVGVNLRFAKELLDISESYSSNLGLQMAFAWASPRPSERDGLRPYIAIHARHGGASHLSLFLPLRFI